LIDVLWLFYLFTKFWHVHLNILTVKSMFTIDYGSDFKLENENIIMHTIFMNINQISNHKIKIYFLEFFQGIQSKVSRGCNAQHEYFFMKFKLTQVFENGVCS
jgi:hypothetical protein